MVMFDVDWTISGTVQIEADTEDEAHTQFDKLKIEDLLARSQTPTVEVEEVLESLDAGGDPIQKLMRRSSHDAS